MKALGEDQRNWIVESKNKKRCKKQKFQKVTKKELELLKIPVYGILLK